MRNRSYDWEPAVADGHAAGGRHGTVRGVVWRVFASRPRDAIAVFAAAAAAVTIVVNALYLQPGPHPAPIFPVKPRPVAWLDDAGGVAVAVPRPRPAEAGPGRVDPAAARPRTETVAEIQRELGRRGLYDGPVDGVNGPKTDAAIRDFEQASGMKFGGEASEDLLRAIQRTAVRAPAAQRPASASRADPIAELIAPVPSKRVVAVQRGLADFGYGQLKTTGIVDAATKAAIEKFEREHRMPITGQVGDRLVRELAAMTGRPLE